MAICPMCVSASPPAPQKLLGRRTERKGGRQIIIECAQGSREALHFLLHESGGRIVPLLLALGDAKGPIEQSPRCARFAPAFGCLPRRELRESAGTRAQSCLRDRPA